VADTPIRRGPLMPDDKVWFDGELMTVEAVRSQNERGADLLVSSPGGRIQRVFLPADALAAALAPANDGQGDPNRGLACLWGKWMEYATPRIRSAALAVRPLKPYPHQDEAVFAHMLPQPRLRFLLADEPGTGKTIMSSLYLAEGRRRGLIPGKAVIVVPAHLVTKWIRDLHRYFGIEVMRLTAEMGRQPQPLRPDIDLWIVSLDLYTYNEDVRRKVAGPHASWSLAVIDEAHRLTPTSQYLAAGQQLAQVAHHLLLLTATPHRGNEHYFRGLLNLLDPRLYPWDPGQQDYDGKRLHPGSLHFLRRMKEELRDLDGTLLFPQRFAETRRVTLSGAEADAYASVMAYADEWYPNRASLARSVYGKRAASSIHAAHETLQRRRASLLRPQTSRVDPITPDGWGDETFNGAALDDDEAWTRAEEVVVAARSANRRAEIDAVDALLARLRAVRNLPQLPAKWDMAREILVTHGLTPVDPKSQLLVFTEFVDTASWLRDLFIQDGFSCEVLEGSTDTETRDHLQQQFMNREFQVLVSTDAGGEGIDLQSAYVMINWDIPWSLVRLEQRMGRLHRIGQHRDVHIYHLVAPATREGRVQEVMLENLDAAGQALQGRIFDLLDATAGQLGFNYARALAQAQQSPSAGAMASALVPRVDTLVAAARELAREEDRLRSPLNLDEARERFTADRLEAINPVIVEGFLHRVAATEGWRLRNGPASGILLVSAPSNLPASLGGGRSTTISADGAAVRRAWENGVNVAHVIVLGPTEQAFTALVDRASNTYEEHLVRGVAAEDPSSLSDYTEFVWACDLVGHDGVKSEIRPTPLLVRYSGTEAFRMAWEAVLKLVPGVAPASVPSPAARVAAEETARQVMAAEGQQLASEKRSWVDKARSDLDDIEARYQRQIASYPEEVRPHLRQEFKRQKAERLEQLDRIAAVSASGLRLVGWLQVRGTAAVGQIGWDPDSEKVAVAAVMTELSTDYIVDDRQTAGVGYDLFARHRRTGEVRLVEVKGLEGDLAPITLEQHEWAQAQQRRDDYWLYVVAHCAERPRVVIRVHNPAEVFTGGAREIRRFQIPVKKLRSVMEA
jgi:superfamily II DNA or RNA helicase